MLIRQDLEQAVVVLEEQRAVLGNDVVDIAVVALRQKLASLQARPTAEQHEQITVLVADLSGFTAMSELMDAEEVRDTINAVWQKLDGVIEAWGGRIDKHTGDGVIALFGVPAAREDDPERAVRAALDMQMELALFDKRTMQPANETQFSWPHPFTDLHMRIGITAGPVFWGQVGTSEEYTAVGDTMKVAQQLEELAPIGSVLISQAVYDHVHALFDWQPLEAAAFMGTTELARPFIVKRGKPQVLPASSCGVEGIETRLVGRDAELEQLEHVLQATVDGGMAQIVTIVGNRGMGKSRLLCEFQKRLGLISAPVCPFNGRARREAGQAPYALIRDLFTNYFDIHARSSAAVSHEKLAQGIAGIFGEDSDPVRQRAYLMGQLLGFDFADSSHGQEILDDGSQIRESAFRNVAQFFTAVAAEQTAVVLFLEDVQWADEGALDLIEYLLRECREAPLLIVCLARPSLYEKRPSWQTMEHLPQVLHSHLELAPLSPIDSCHLATEILHNIPLAPLRLIELITDNAGGNPLHIEEMVQLLIEDGVIIRGRKQWRVNLKKLRKLQTLPTSAGLLESHSTKE